MSQYIPFRLLMIEVQSSLGIFEGSPKHLFFTYDQIALQQRKYEQAGKLVAWSIVHGGPGLKALDARLYQLMCGVEMELTDFDWCLIPDADVQRKARKVCFCQHDQLFICPFFHVYLKTCRTHISNFLRSYLARHLNTFVLCKEN